MATLSPVTVCGLDSSDNPEPIDSISNGPNVTTSIVDMKPIPLSGRDVVYLTYSSTRDDTTITGGYDLIYRTTS